MKKVFIFTLIALFSAGLGSCKKTEKSAECNIKTFTVADKPWQIEGLNVTGTYEKGDYVTALSPVIVVSKGATWVSSPANAPYDLSADKSVDITVTAEDGKAKKTYKARVMVGSN